MLYRMIRFQKIERSTDQVRTSRDQCLHAIVLITDFPRSMQRLLNCSFTRYSGSMIYVLPDLSVTLLAFGRETIFQISVCGGVGSCSICIKLHACLPILVLPSRLSSYVLNKTCCIRRSLFRKNYAIQWRSAAPPRSE